MLYTNRYLPALKGPTINTQPRIIPRSGHAISRANISPNALKVLYRLKGAGYDAYLVGGGVRDMLLGREPKDFDIATNARPEEVKKLFRNCLLIGRRFRLAHVRFENEIIEVATFRAQGDGASDEEARSENGRILRDNVYGSLEEDAWRRDFTINALYYSIQDFSVVDYVEGMVDLQNGMLRLIGQPRQRYYEDPVRMLRAVRFAAKLGFRIHPESEAPIFELAHLLADIPPARLFDEILKLFLGGCAVQSFELLRHYGLFGYLFPQTEACLAEERDGFPVTLLIRALQNTDTRIGESKPVTPAFLYAALLWEPLRQAMASHEGESMAEIQALQEAASAVETRQVTRTALPKRFAVPMREIWGLQIRLRRTSGLRPLRLLEHPRFRAAYDFMLLRRDAGEDVGELCQWWTEFQGMDENERLKRVRAGNGKGKKRRARRAKGRSVSNKTAE
ncbi:MAG: polynucleotide adenylyltransferase PcnB [Gammaproteobacteria bacterium]